MIQLARRQAVDAGGRAPPAAAGKAFAQTAGRKARRVAGAHADDVTAVGVFAQHRARLALARHQLVGEQAGDAPRPRFGRQHVDRAAGRLPGRPQGRHQAGIGPVAVAQRAVAGRAVDKVKRVGVVVHGPVQRVRRDVQVGRRFAVGVVVQDLAQALQFPAGRLVQAGRAGQRAPGCGQIVAKGGHRRPGPEPSAQVAVDQDAAAHLGRVVPEQLQARVRERLARRMVVEIGDAAAAVEDALQGRGVAVERDVEHGDVERGRLGQARQQCDVALDAADQVRRLRVGQAQLVQRANTVGVAVENVVGQAGARRHVRRPPKRRARCWYSARPASSSAMMPVSSTNAGCSGTS